MRIIRKIEEAMSGSGPCEEARCGCGSLLARVVGGEVELKCRRCKSVWRIALTPAPDEPEAGGRRQPRRGPAAARDRAAEEPGR
jgi:phage FluMu protein Com